MIKFLKFCVTNGAARAKVHYSLDNRADGRKCVTLYARDYSRTLGEIFAAEYVNDTDSQTDYFDQGRVTLFEHHALYPAARARAESILTDRAAKAAAKARAPMMMQPGFLTCTQAE
jgi:hypothetical protein